MKLKSIWKNAAQESLTATASVLGNSDCRDGDFSLNSRLLKDILVHAKPLGHNQKRRNRNLGFGFIYYGVVRSLRPKHTFVIGSGYGFSVVCLALGIKDNGAGRLSFLDPSYSLIKDGPGKTAVGEIRNFRSSLWGSDGQDRISEESYPRPLRRQRMMSLY